MNGKVMKYTIRFEVDLIINRLRPKYWIFRYCYLLLEIFLSSLLIKILLIAKTEFPLKAFYSFISGVYRFPINQSKKLN